MALMGASICWVVTETDTPFTIFDKLPTGTSAMAFSYDGQMGEDATGGSDEEFWHDPFR